MMETSSHPRGRGSGLNGTGPRGRGRGGSKNKHWTAPGVGGTDSDRWERGGHRGGGRGRGTNRSIFTRGGAPPVVPQQDESEQEEEIVTDTEDHSAHEEDEETQPEPEVVDYQELLKAREVERKKAIAEGKMDDPLVPKRLEDAITMVGTCMDMCPRFERYRRERENNLTEWEVIPGTKKVDHKKAVKMYERAAGDKTLPSDLRPPHVLKKTLDYLFHDLLPRGGFSPTFSFIRDRSRAARSDFTMQHETGPIAIECHDRCARYHILALHFQRDQPGFSVALEEQLLMNTLQSLKEFYEDQRGKYESPTELEMRVYHRLIHIRDQRERHDDIPTHILHDPVFELITKFRQHVQAKSAPITKISALKVGQEGMAIFGELADVLRQKSNTVMIYLMACILERLFGKDAIQDDLEGIRGDLSVPDVIDGILTPMGETGMHEEEEEEEEEPFYESPVVSEPPQPAPWSTPPTSVFGPPTGASPFGSSSVPKDPLSIPVNNAFSGLVATPNAFGTISASPFGGGSVFGQPTKSVFGNTTAPPAPAPAPAQPSPFTGNGSPFGAKPSPFGTSVPPNSQSPFGAPISQPSPFGAPATAPPNPAPPLFPSAQPKPLNAAAPAFTPSFNSPSPFQSISNKPITTTPSTLLQPSNGVPSSQLFSTPPPVAPQPTISLPTPTSEVPPLVSKQQTLSDFPSPASSSPRPHRIFTDLSIPSPAASPRVPPPAPKPEPLSLPPTAPNTPLVQRPSLKSNKSLKGFPSIQTISTDVEMLSPLRLSSPSVSRFPFPNQTKSPAKSESSMTLKPNGSVASTSKRVWSKSEANQKMSAFKARSIIIKEVFKHWKKRASDRAEYTEAVRRSEEYSRRVQRERMMSASGSVSSISTSDRKRRVSGMSPDAAQKKRAKKRASGHYVPPRTDEDLVRRLKENHDEHERRWAPGTFLQTLKSRVKPPPQWRAWLSMNPDNDGTAIWLERKFDVPSSGRWFTENVFSMDMSPSEPSSSSPKEHPGVIVFECTPLDGLDDEIEKKYRILDDCSRLRDVMIALPEDRHYIPSLVLIVWTDDQLVEAGSELQKMIKGLLDEKILKMHSIFSVSTSGKDMDSRFSDVIASMSLDTEGELVQPFTGQALFRAFSSPWDEAVTEWAESCSSDEQVDWVSCGECIQSAVKLLDHAIHHVSALLNHESAVSMPPLWLDDIMDSESVYLKLIPWLELSEWNGATKGLLQNLRSLKNLAVDFPTTTLFENLPLFVEALFEGSRKLKFGSVFSVLKEEFSVASQRFERELQNENDELIKSRTIRNSRIAKRRSSNSTPASSNKRPRTSFLNGDSASPPPEPTPSQETTASPPSPSPSVTSVGGSSKAPVTLEMLRELTRSVMKGYGT